MKGGTMEEDISLVKSDGMKLHDIPDENKTPELIHFAINKNGMALQFVPSAMKSRGMVYEAIRKNGMSLQFAGEFLHDNNMVKLALNINGLALQFADDFKSDIEVVYVAIIQNGMALQFADQSLRGESDASVNVIQLCITAVKQNGMALQFVLGELKNNKDIVFTALLNNKHALQFVSKVLQKHPDIQSLFNKGSPPNFIRGHSVVFTDQTDQATCGRHVFSKVILKNIFEVLYPLPMTKEDNHSYNQVECNNYLITGTKINDISKLLPESCSVNGYIKILLFLHLYHLYQQHVLTPQGKPEGYLQCVQASEIYEHMYEPYPIPTSTLNQQANLDFILKDIKHKVSHYKIFFATFHLHIVDVKRMFDIIQTVTDEHLYVMLALDNTTSKDVSHFVLATSTNGTNVEVKNSWGAEKIYEFSIDKPMGIGPYIWNEYTYCSFVIPIIGDEDITLKDDTRLGEMIGRFNELQAILAAETEPVTLPFSE